MDQEIYRLKAQNSN